MFIPPPYSPKEKAFDYEEPYDKENLGNNNFLSRFIVITTAGSLAVLSVLGVTAKAMNNGYTGPINPEIVCDGLKSIGPDDRLYPREKMTVEDFARSLPTTGSISNIVENIVYINPSVIDLNSNVAEIVPNGNTVYYPLACE